MLTVEMIKEARERISPYIHKTPLIRLSNLDEHLGCQVYAKVESMQRTNSFKVRGALNASMSLSEEELARGIVTFSSGNHGKAMSYSAKVLGAKAYVVAPNTAPKIKMDGIRSYGAEIIFCNPADQLETAKSLSKENGWSFISPYDDYRIMAGQGTAGLEIMEQLEDVDYILVPIGGGGLVSGLSTAIKETKPKIKVIGMEPAAVPRYSESYKAGRHIHLPSDSKSVADGLQTLTPGDLNYPVIEKHVDRIYTVKEENILKATKLFLTEGKLLAEFSSCITVGAILQGEISFKADDKVVFLISGGNMGLDQLNRLEEVHI